MNPFATSAIGRRDVLFYSDHLCSSRQTESYQLELVGKQPDDLNWPPLSTYAQDIPEPPRTPFSVMQTDEPALYPVPRQKSFVPKCGLWTYKPHTLEVDTESDSASEEEEYQFDLCAGSERQLTPDFDIYEEPNGRDEPFASQPVTPHEEISDSGFEGDADNDDDDDYNPSAFQRVPSQPSISSPPHSRRGHRKHQTPAPPMDTMKEGQLVEIGKKFDTFRDHAGKLFHLCKGGDCDPRHRTKTRGDMTHHLQSLSHSEKKWACECDKTFTRKDALVRHTGKSCKRLGSAGKPYNPTSRASKRTALDEDKRKLSSKKPHQTRIPAAKRPKRSIGASER